MSTVVHHAMIKGIPNMSIQDEYTMSIQDVMLRSLLYIPDFLSLWPAMT